MLKTLHNYCSSLFRKKQCGNEFQLQIMGEKISPEPRGTSDLTHSISLLYTTPHFGQGPDVEGQRLPSNAKSSVWKYSPCHCEP
ncbi:hypothetical protein CEXT_757751 [Caerostris extrusa]|uniref:Uncharacterized protein n=1 Tax=Caerostris extrusa TaxID=172846 RepID=A0AAV4P4S8_CAEEX|nr:hypothetical protein CEXT_757751 [Caerostris extrusa]